MYSFREFKALKETEIISEGMDPEKRDVLLKIKSKHSKYGKFVNWLVKLHAGVMDDSIPLAKAMAVLKQMDQYSSFADVDRSETPNYIPDGKLANIYKPQLLGKNPDLSQYEKTRSGMWQRRNFQKTN